MESTKNTKLGGLQSTFSRRNLLKGTTALTAAASIPEAFGKSRTVSQPAPPSERFGFISALIRVVTPDPAALTGRGFICARSTFTRGSYPL